MSSPMACQSKHTAIYTCACISQSWRMHKVSTGNGQKHKNIQTFKHMNFTRPNAFTGRNELSHGLSVQAHCNLHLRLHITVMAHAQSQHRERTKAQKHTNFQTHEFHKAQRIYRAE